MKLGKANSRTGTNEYLIQLTKEEEEVIKKVDKLLLQIQLEYGRQTELTSIYTGEFISMDEIPRIRGFLNCLQENWCYALEINRKGE